ncbi:MAG: hypothetical protein AVDCRST_MAG88-3042 [uncultured Thermomicrobiales bacterium]|uniref:DUF4367 domain-containing protein n=1 Tax=uncultured Thermomicrobiales bacterium TaxID=1645740 RepID=A0A6J4VKA2_9BACT|nr:MAG: hypothetical protein AVDCRST_MAG88-3042 [uncultured Thermomicrobiales bacterium]
MTDRLPRGAEGDLERQLRDLGPRLAFPPTPDLASTVRERLATGPAPRRPLAFLFPLASAPSGVRRLALVVLALLVLGAVFLLLSPGGRRAVAERLGLRGIIIVYPTAIPPGATSTPQPTPAPIGSGWGFGERVGLDEARGRVAYRILVPSLPELDAPDEVYVGAPPVGGQVALVWRSRPGLPAAPGPGLLVTQFRGEINPGFFQKGIAPGTRVEEVRPNGGLGYWIDGAPHLFFYRDHGGLVREERLRLAGNTLLWEQEGLTFRIEGAATKEDALRIAASLR